MYSFKNDYSEGAHHRILKALADTNLEQSETYGEDSYSLQAAELIKETVGARDIDVHFLTGGTQTNLTAISAFLRPHEAAIAAETGHVLVHETGAIEATGHKVISINSGTGKLSADDVQKVLAYHSDEHMVKPKLVYISNSTEIGSIYKKQELEALSKLCRAEKVFLYVDGARLGSALSATDNDVSLSDLAGLVDAFYIGGTKNGALLGEALVICNAGLKEDFRYHMKQKGALLAKGRIIGLQFLELFKDGLYFELANHANAMAGILKDGLVSSGYKFITDPLTNQLFPVLPNVVINKLREKYSFYTWSIIDNDNSAVRLVTSWATSEEAVNGFVQDLKAAASK